MVYEAGPGYEGQSRCRIKIQLDREVKVRDQKMRECLENMKHDVTLLMYFLSKGFGKVDNQDLTTSSIESQD